MESMTGGSGAAPFGRAERSSRVSPAGDSVVTPGVCTVGAGSGGGRRARSMAHVPSSKSTAKAATLEARLLRSFILRRYQLRQYQQPYTLPAEFHCTACSLSAAHTLTPLPSRYPSHG